MASNKKEKLAMKKKACNCYGNTMLTLLLLVPLKQNKNKSVLISSDLEEKEKKKAFRIKMI